MHLLGQSIVVPLFYQEVCNWIAMQMCGMMPIFHGTKARSPRKEMKRAWWDACASDVKPLTTEMELFQLHETLEGIPKMTSTDGISANYL